MKNNGTKLENNIVKEGLGKWTTVCFKTGKKVKPYVRIKEHLTDQEQERLEELMEDDRIEKLSMEEFIKEIIAE